MLYAMVKFLSKGTKNISLIIDKWTKPKSKINQRLQRCPSIKVEFKPQKYN